MKIDKKWIKDRQGFLLGLIVTSVFIIAIFFLRSNQLSEKVQAGSVIALIFLTGYYAKQTQKLVEEQRKSLEVEIEKRQAEYGEKRIIDFFSPLFNNLLELHTALQGILHSGPEKTAGPMKEYYEEELTKARAALSEIKEVFYSKQYMVNSFLGRDILDFIIKVDLSWPTGPQERDFDNISLWAKENDPNIEGLRSKLVDEMTVIEVQMQKFYRYFVPPPSP